MSAEQIEGFRLSPAQAHLWRLAAGGVGPFRSQAVVALHGDPDRKTLERALGLVVDRFEILRTSFHQVADLGMPLQAIAEGERPDLRERELPPDGAAAEEAWDTLCREEWEAIAAEGPVPLRACLVHGDGVEPRLVLTLPALCADRRSLSLLVDHLAEAYGELAGPGAGEPGPEAAQYVDVSEWQHELFEAEETAAGREFWASLDLAEALECRLAAEGRSGPLPPTGPARRHGLLDREAVERARELASRWGVPLEALVLTCWQTLLARVSDRGLVLSGVASDGRKHEELVRALGPLTAYLPLAARWRPAEPLEAAAREVVERLDEMGRRQEYLRWDPGVLRVVRSGELSPPFVFEWDEESRPRAAADVQLELLSRRTWTEGCRLLLRGRPRDGALLLELEHNPGALEPGEAERLLSSLRALLGSVVETQDAPAAALEMLAPEERERLAAGLHSAERGLPGTDRLLHELVEEAAGGTPDAVALTWDGDGLSYSALDRRANRLARLLRRRGVRPGDRVGIALPRSPQAVIAMLATLKAGGCYVPLDPEYPRERLAQMIEDADPALILGEAGAGPVLSVEEAEALAAREPDERLERWSSPGDLAYVLFTSGSTGRPKGVMVSHRSIVHHLAGMRQVAPLGPGDRVIQKTAFNFDPSLWEVFAPLASSACLVLARPGGHRDVPYLAQRIEAERVRVLRVVPTLLRALLADPGFGVCGGLEKVLCGGEALRPDLLERFRSALPDAALVNVYGPTEATVVTTTWACPRDGELDRVPIGRPLSNARVYVLDPALRPVPAGAAGEICTAGVHLARGYLGRPGATAARFTPDPHAPRPGRRLYRTADLGRLLPGGEVEFLGRLDHQVKLRGFRLELCEVETLLERHPAVSRAAAALREDEPGRQRLVAYWVGQNGAEAPSSELLDHLLRWLPEFSTPAVFVRLEDLPLTPNGKLDRQALPEPTAEDLASDVEYVMPRTAEEEVFAGIWSEVLGVERVGVEDNFFVLGADSIQALRVVALAKERGLHVPLTALFQHQSVEELVAHLKGLDQEDPEVLRTEPFGLVSPEDRARLPAGLEDAYPMTSMQLGMLYHMQMNPDSPSYHNVNSFLFEARFDEGHFRAAVARVVARHPILRTSFDLDGYGEPLQLVHREAQVPLEVEDLRGLPKEAQDRVIDALVERERGRLFDLSEPPQIRYFVHRISDGVFWFTQVDNHAIVDGWSLTSILREIFTLHNALVYGREPPEEPPLETTFRDFVHLERRALESPESREFWCERLDGVRRIRLPRWPSAVERGPDQRVRVIPVSFPDELSDRVKALARKLAVPVKSVCLAAHLKVMSLIGGTEDVVTGIPTHGRPETVDGERVRGLFVNTAPFRYRLSDESWSELVVGVFSIERRMLAHRRFPLAAIQRLSGGEPLFEVLFNFVEFHHLNALLDHGELEVRRDYKFWATPHYPLMCGFNQHPPLGELTMRLYYDTRELTLDQVRTYGEWHVRALQAMTASPEAGQRELDVAGAEEARARQLLREKVDISDFEQGFAF